MKGKSRKLFLPHKYFAGLSGAAKTRRRGEIAKFGALNWKDPRAYVGFKTDKGVKGKSSSYTEAWKRAFPGADSLEAKAEVSGVPLWAIKESYNRGMAAWRTGHRPGATEQQWGYARVHSLLMCGKTYATTDSDIVKRAKAASGSARTYWSRACRLSPVAFKE
jgi:hypothetical protein